MIQFVGIQLYMWVQNLEYLMEQMSVKPMVKVCSFQANKLVPQRATKLAHSLDMTLAKTLVSLEDKLVQT